MCDVWLSSQFSHWADLVRGFYDKKWKNRCCDETEAMQCKYNATKEVRKLRQVRTFQVLSQSLSFPTLTSIQLQIPSFKYHLKQYTNDQINTAIHSPNSYVKSPNSFDFNPCQFNQKAKSVRQKPGNQTLATSGGVYKLPSPQYPDRALLESTSQHQSAGESFRSGDGPSSMWWGLLRGPGVRLRWAHRFWWTGMHGGIRTPLRIRVRIGLRGWGCVVFVVGVCLYFEDL